ncbi:MAG TPA: ATP-binding cassette domain-containing protein [Solirubrobacteraceae bacterium]|nr:ATP-binding cassette domain-containing protein [Solirubrobacteraceae bacterium]
MSLLELDRVSYAYPGRTQPSLCDVSLRVRPGELVVVAGRSGSGKSTLLRVVSGLVPHFHGGRFAGRATVAALDTREHGPGDLATRVGTLFQDPETQVVMGTVRAELALPLENRGQAPAVVARAVEETALALGITHLLDRSTAELSGGELQRVALGAALSGAPQLLVLDEPTSQLDPVAGDELITTLRRLNEDRDTAILLAEHRLERCLAFADRVVALEGGRIVCDASPAEFLVWALRAAPDLATPGARLLDLLGLLPVAGVKRARAALRDAHLEPVIPDVPEAEAGRENVPPAAEGTHERKGHSAPPRGQALRVQRVWHELREGPVILRAVSVEVGAGERVALMGANGAGKSTLLRHAAGLMRPTRGRIIPAGRVALLLQNPTDYLVHDTVSAEAPASALRTVGLDPAQLGLRHPRELSVGEKQRLALAVVLGDPGDEPPAVLCLDEPTRGMDRGLKRDLARLLTQLEPAVIVATHDPEFVADFADRVILLGAGRVIADGPVADILASGAYFTTETARIMGGAGGALTPSQGAALFSGHPRVSSPAPDLVEVPL